VEVDHFLTNSFISIFIQNSVVIVSIIPIRLLPDQPFKRSLEIPKAPSFTVFLVKVVKLGITVFAQFISKEFWYIFQLVQLVVSDEVGFLHLRHSLLHLGQGCPWHADAGL